MKNESIHRIFLDDFVMRVIPKIFYYASFLSPEYHFPPIRSSEYRGKWPIEYRSIFLDALQNHSRTLVALIIVLE